MCFRSLELRTICHATESLEKVRTAFLFLCPDCEVSEKRTEGHYGNPLVVLEGTVRGKRAIADFFKRLIDAGQEEAVMASIEDRIDDDSFLHLRFDKDKAFIGEMEIAEHENVITLRGKILSYPSRRADAVENFIRFVEKVKA